MDNKQQTAVEYLVEQLFPKALSVEQHYHIEQAKEIEWDQINNAYLQGFNDNDCNPHEDTFNLYYYNKTYGGGEQ